MLKNYVFQQDEKSVDQNIDQMLQDLYGKQEALELLDDRIAQVQQEHENEELALFTVEDAICWRTTLCAVAFLLLDESISSTFL